MILIGTPEGFSLIKPGDKVDYRLEDNAPGVELAEIEFEADMNGRYEFKE